MPIYQNSASKRTFMKELKSDLISTRRIEKYILLFLCLSMRLSLFGIFTCFCINLIQEFFHYISLYEKLKHPSDRGPHKLVMLKMNFRENYVATYHDFVPFLDISKKMKEIAQIPIKHTTHIFSTWFKVFYRYCHKSPHIEKYIFG